ncbi:MAG: glutamate-1-semialdehyde 2,1-aminomutase [Chloroflexi bacterium]|nr:glutamate-1-semialdehyde 2,1-aminomutase [Chloroflexota bacterium]
MNTAHSQELFQRAKELIPGGVNSPARSWGSVGGNPLFITRAAGSRVWDADDNEFIDYVCSWGPMILGHAHPDVVSAVTAAAEKGTSYGAPTEGEVRLAELVVDSVPSIEIVRFVNSGTEATMSALRLARAFTGRSKIVKFDGGYHGHGDALLVKAGSGLATAGVPTSAGIHAGLAADTIVLPYNDSEALEKAFGAHPGEIAAVIAEPIAGNMGVVPPQPGYLDAMREITERDGALLIFDEVISGFRVGLDGAQGMFNVTPDLTCLGKIVGGGLPVGAYGGRADVMAIVAPLGPMYQAGTLSGNPLAMAAGIATLEQLREPAVYDELERLGTLLETGMTRVFADAEVPMTINRVGSLLTVFFSPGPVRDMADASAGDHDAFGRWFHGLLEAGIYIAPSDYEAWFVSLAHTEADIQQTVSAAKTALESV